MSSILTVLSSVFASSVVAAGIIFVFKTFISEGIKAAIQHEYAQKLEALKVQLQCESEKEIERLKAQLQVTAAERNVRYSRVFERAAEALEGIFSRTVELQGAIFEYTGPALVTADRDETKLKEIAGQKLDEFMAYYRPRVIYLPRETDKKIQEYIKALQGFLMRFAMLKMMPPTNPSWEKHSKEVVATQTEELPKLYTIMAESLHKVIGLADSEPEPTRKGVKSDSAS